MLFEYDPDKSAANKAKHGIDFDEAQALWQDEWLLEAPARTDDEPRFLVVGKIGKRHWTAVCVRRSEATRMISVRRSRAQGLSTMSIKATEFDRKFEAGEDIDDLIDWKAARRPNLEQSA